MARWVDSVATAGRTGANGIKTLSPLSPLRVQTNTCAGNRGVSTRSIAKTTRGKQRDEHAIPELGLFVTSTAKLELVVLFLRLFLK